MRLGLFFLCLIEFRIRFDRCRAKSMINLSKKLGSIDTYRIMRGSLEKTSLTYVILSFSLGLSNTRPEIILGPTVNAYQGYYYLTRCYIIKLTNKILIKIR